MRLAQSWIAVTLMLLCGGARVLAAAQDTSPSLKVEEDKMRFHLLPHSGLEFPIRNTSAQQVSGKFALELLNLEDDSVAAALFGTFTEQPGETIEKIAWSADKLPTDAPSELGWYRLRYTFTPDASPAVAPVTGIVQLGRIITDGFAISMAAAKSVAPGTKYPVRVHVENPTTRQAYANILVELSVLIGNDHDTAIKRKARTDSAGNATVLFHLPEHPADQEGTITADVARGTFSEEESLDFQFPDEPAPAVTITTDKPLYQPGQTVHIRLLTKGMWRSKTKTEPSSSTKKWLLRDLESLPRIGTFQVKCDWAITRSRCDSSPSRVLIGPVAAVKSASAGTSCRLSR
jgi:hypothetical protein